MSSKTLSALMEGYFSGIKRETTKPSFLKEMTVLGQVKNNLPITIDDPVWTIKANPERLSRAFIFKSLELRNYFLSEVLGYEKDYGHSAEICIEGLSVKVEVYTHDLLSVTELDKEYADHCDMVFNDLNLWSSNR